MKHLLLSFLAISLSLTQVVPAEAQTIELLGGNTLNGAITGTMLGGATMALRNSNDFAPLRVGLGAGTLFGIGTGIYDISQASKGGIYYVSGVFNDGNNSSIIVLLDTFYGAAAGAIIASSFNLIANEPVRDALQYGAGAGAFAGFGFGLIDSFILAEKPGDFGPPPPTGNAGGSGMVSITDAANEYTLNLLHPAIYSTARLNASEAGVTYTHGIDVVHLNIRL